MESSHTERDNDHRRIYSRFFSHPSTSTNDQHSSHNTSTDPNNRDGKDYEKSHHARRGRPRVRQSEKNQTKPAHQFRFSAYDPHSMKFQQERSTRLSQQQVHHRHHREITRRSQRQANLRSQLQMYQLAQEDTDPQSQEQTHTQSHDEESSQLQQEESSRGRPDPENYSKMCYFWHTFGCCNRAAGECGYIHRDTGLYADGSEHHTERKEAAVHMISPEDPVGREQEPQLQQAWLQHREEWLQQWQGWLNNKGREVYDREMTVLQRENTISYREGVVVHREGLLDSAARGVEPALRALTVAMLADVRKMQETGHSALQQIEIGRTAVTHVEDGNRARLLVQDWQERPEQMQHLLEGSTDAMKVFMGELREFELKMDWIKGKM